MAQLSETKEDVANQLIHFGNSEQEVAKAQSKASNPCDINEVVELLRSAESNNGGTVMPVYKRPKDDVESPPHAMTHTQSVVRTPTNKSQHKPHNSLEQKQIEFTLHALSDEKSVDDVPTDTATLYTRSSSISNRKSRRRRKSSLNSPRHLRQAEYASMTDGELLEEIQDVLIEVNYDLSQEHAKEYLYELMDALGKNKGRYRKRIDYVAEEITRQRGEALAPSWNGKGSKSVLSKLPENPEIMHNLTEDDDPTTPDTYNAEMRKLREESEYKRIQEQFQNDIKKLIENNTKEQLAWQAANYWCKYEKCPCIARIDILMKTYHDLVNSEFWLKVPITPLVTLGDRYQHQQLHDDFIHIKMFHVDRHLRREMERQDSSVLIIPEDEEEEEVEEKKDEEEDPGETYKKKMKEEYVKSEYKDPSNVGSLLHIRFSRDYPCPAISNCPGFTRHYRDRGSGTDEDRLFHSFNDRSIGARTRYIKNEKERTMQEECDKIHSYFLHSTIQLPSAFDDTEMKENDQKTNSVVDGITSSAKGRSFSRRLGDTAWMSRIERVDHEIKAKKQGKNEKKKEEEKEAKDQEDDGQKAYVGKKEDEDWIQAAIGNLPESKRYEALVDRMGVFRWQSAHGFRPGQERGLSHLKPRFANMKEEALNNSFSRASKDNWNQTLRKAKIFKESFASKRIRTLYDGSYKDHVTGVVEEWKKGTVITLQEIVTLKLYTDFDKLQHELKKCFRWETITTVIHGKEDDESERKKREELQQRLEEFFYWRSGLLIVLNKFGKKFRHQNKGWHLYHGVNAKMILNPVETMAFHGPLSTTTSQHVAKTFATAKGMVLEITSQYPRLDFCCAFDASALSDYPEEQEYLIGFVYLRVLHVFTRPLVNNILKADEWRDQPVASQLRAAFFAIHLFREQMFSMSEHLEYYLVQFLKCFKKECCRHGYAEKQKLQKEGRGDEIKNIETRALMRDEIKFSFLSWLCTYIAVHPYPLTKKSLWEKGYNKRKNRFADNDWKLVMKVLWKKFNEYRVTPNLKQVIKIDRISKNLKQFFLSPDLNNHGKQKQKLKNKNQGKWCVDFEKILAIFPNCREIHYFNEYRFDKEALGKLVKTLEARKGDDSIPFWRLRFLYYDYSESKEAKTKDGLGIPEDGDYFYNPDNLMDEEKELMDRLKVLGWWIHWDVCQTVVNGQKRSYGCRIKISRKRRQNFDEFRKNHECKGAHYHH